MNTDKPLMPGEITAEFSIGGHHVYMGMLNYRPAWPGVGEILRQINLYREYIEESIWVLATVFTLSEEEVQQLKGQKVIHFVLAERFKEFCRKQPERSGTAAAVEI